MVGIQKRIVCTSVVFLEVILALHWWALIDGSPNEGSRSTTITDVEMAFKHGFFVGICIFSSCIMLILSSDVVAAQDDALTIPRRELGAYGQLAKDIYGLYKVWNRRKKAYDLINITMAEAEKQVDQQCPQNPHQYCCLVDNLYLYCLQCCVGTRPDGSVLSFSASPSPLPMPSSSTRGFLPSSSWNQHFTLLAFACYMNVLLNM